MTVDEYARLPDDTRRYELQLGVLLSEPIPFPRHGQIQVRLARALAEFVDANLLGVVLTDTGYLLSRNPDTLRGPDVSFVCRERFDQAKSEQAFFRGAPDLAVEILSPSNRATEIHAKVADYLAAGATLVWVIDPKRETALIHRSLLAPRRVEMNESLDGEDVLPGFSLPLALLLQR